MEAWTAAWPWTSTPLSPPPQFIFLKSLSRFQPAFNTEILNVVVCSGLSGAEAHDYKCKVIYGDFDPSASSGPASAQSPAAVYNF